MYKVFQEGSEIGSFETKEKAVNYLHNLLGSNSPGKDYLSVYESCRHKYYNGADDTLEVTTFHIE